jgi:hypothetical protein
MSVSTTNTTNGVEIRLAAYHNCDDVQLFCRAVVDGEEDAPVPECLGYVIERRRLGPCGQWRPTEVLRNRVSFSGERGEGEGTPESGHLLCYETGHLTCFLHFYLFFLDDIQRSAYRTRAFTDLMRLTKKSSRLNIYSKKYC